MVGPALDQGRASPGEHQAEHVGEIVAGVREQGHGSGDQAVHRLDRDERQVEDDADGKGIAEVGG